MGMEKVILALDFDSVERATPWIRVLAGRIWGFKVGLELYVAAGVRAVDEIKVAGGRVFLDLKLHDIPNTVEKTCRKIAALSVDLITVHGLGGERMIQAAVEGLSSGGLSRGACQRTELFAVTVLTSLGNEDLKRAGIFLGEDVSSVAMKIAETSALAGADGIVCSAHEVGRLKQRFRDQLKLLTPGIRFSDEGDSTDDQRRVMDPLGAIGAGADYLVMGRTLTRIGDPIRALERLEREFRI